MTKTTARHTLQRRTFDLHVAALLQLRRQHGHSSFFDDRGHVRDYAQDYLLAWMAPDLTEQAGEIRRLHLDATADATLEELGTIIPRVAQWRAEHLCLEVLRILETDEVAFYDEGVSDEQRGAQMAELGDAYTVIDNPYWDHCEDDDNVVYLR